MTLGRRRPIGAAVLLMLLAAPAFAARPHGLVYGVLPQTNELFRRLLADHGVLLNNSSYPLHLSHDGGEVGRRPGEGAVPTRQ